MEHIVLWPMGFSGCSRKWLRGSWLSWAVLAKCLLITENTLAALFQLHLTVRNRLLNSQSGQYVQLFFYFFQGGDCYRLCHQWNPAVSTPFQSGPTYLPFLLRGSLGTLNLQDVDNRCVVKLLSRECRSVISFLIDKNWWRKLKGGRGWTQVMNGLA